MILRGRQFLCKVANLALPHYGAGHIGARSFSPGKHFITGRACRCFLIYIFSCLEVRIVLGLFEQTVDAPAFCMRQGYCSLITRLRGCWRLHSVKAAEDKRSSKSRFLFGCGIRWGSWGSDHDIHEQATLVWSVYFCCARILCADLRISVKGFVNCLRSDFIYPVNTSMEMTSGACLCKYTEQWCAVNFNWSPFLFLFRALLLSL